MQTNNIAIIFAGGVGQRLNNDVNSTPKQFLKVYNKPIIIHTLELFQQNENINKIYISIVESHLDYIKELVEYYHLTKVAGITTGGTTGQDSIYKALKMAEKENDKDSLVLIHDGVRPNITQEVINLNIENAKLKGSSITSTPAYETILFSENGQTPTSVPYRRQTFAAQAPQTFKLGEIVQAHEQERKTNPNYTDIVDSCTLFTKQGKPTYMIRGNFGNIKITTIEDLYVLRALIICKEDMNALGIDKIGG
ncbi:MAG: 2-C-methyl-D-erythritol 4-phosphate cytidylyltransferase [Candidatus Gastranaerophilales bacterium]|nr:2-C-methyl-D-erythritol 4-phosphate cytidylyltransferase [Candidatus Gastranaerophilales bacterium]